MKRDISDSAKSLLKKLQCNDLNEELQAEADLFVATSNAYIDCASDVVEKWSITIRTISKEIDEHILMLDSIIEILKGKK